MKLTIDMPWEKNLSINAMRFGKPSPKARGKWRKFRVRKPEVQGWMSRLSHEIWFGRGVLETFSYERRVIVDFRFPDNRRRDTHNYFKAICDAVARGLGIDDKDIRISTGTVTVDKANAGFTIHIEDREETDGT